MKFSYLKNDVKLLEKWIYKQVCSNDYRIFRLFLLHSKREKNTFNIFQEKVKTFLRILKMPLYLRIGTKLTQNIAYASSSNKKKVISYIESYDNKKDIFFLSSSIFDPIYISSFSDIFRFIKNYLSALKDIFLLLVLSTQVSTKELSYFLYLKVKILQYKPEKLYLYSTQELNSNLLTFFSANCLKIDTDIIIGTMEMKQRYAYYSDVRLCYMSRITKIQQESFMKIGWTKVKDIEILITGNIEQIVKGDKGNESLYDIGFFSSGFWARSGLWRANDIEKIKRNKEEYCKNIYAKIEMIILGSIVRLAKQYNFTFKIYLHPYEKELIKKYNIYPPFWNLQNEYNICIDDNISIKNNFFEAKIGIVMMSSIFQDRWDNHLYTLCFDPKNKKKMDHIRLKYLGDYSKYGFKNIKELEEKILNKLEIGEKL